MTHLLTEPLITCNLDIVMHSNNTKSKRIVLRKYVHSHRTLMSFMYSPRIINSKYFHKHLTVHALDKQQLTKPSGPAITFKILVRFFPKDIY